MQTGQTNRFTIWIFRTYRHNVFDHELIPLYRVGAGAKARSRVTLYLKNRDVLRVVLVGGSVRLIFGNASTLLALQPINKSNDSPNYGGNKDRIQKEINDSCQTKYI